MIFVPYPRIKNSKTIAVFSVYAPALVPLAPDLKKAYRNYRANKGSPAVVLPLNYAQAGKVSPAQKTELDKLYASTYKKLKENHRHLDWAYDLRKADNLPYCPMCGNTGRDALDHYLPKADYPEFAVLSFNLVPTCTSCNSKRSNSANAPRSPLPLIHPYFDGRRLSSPLVVVVIDPDKGTTPPTYLMPSFRLVPAIAPTDALFARLANHLDKCVDETQLRRWLTGRWKLWRLKAPDYSTLAELRKAIDRELQAEIDVGGMNNWTAAFLRGLLVSPSVLQWMMKHPPS